MPWPYSVLLIRRKPSRYLPAVLAVGFSTLLVNLQVGMLLGFLASAVWPIERIGADLWVGSRDFAALGSRSATCAPRKPARSWPSPPASGRWSAGPGRPRPCCSPRPGRWWSAPTSNRSMPPSWGPACRRSSATTRPRGGPGQAVIRNPGQPYTFSWSGAGRVQEIRACLELTEVSKTSTGSPWLPWGQQPFIPQGTPVPLALQRNVQLSR
jgi:hypothetical protein